MAFSRHLGAVKRQLDEYLRQRNGDDDAVGGGSAGLSRTDFDTDSFLMFLGRSHPHIVRLKRRVLDKLLETAKAELDNEKSAGGLIPHPQKSQAAAESPPASTKANKHTAPDRKPVKASAAADSEIQAGCSDASSDSSASFPVEVIIDEDGCSDSDAAEEDPRASPCTQEKRLRANGGEGRHRPAPASAGPRERSPLNSSLNSLYRSHAMETQKTGGQVSSANVHAQETPLATAEEDPTEGREKGGKKGKEPLAAGGEETGTPKGERTASQTQLKKRKRSRSLSSHASFLSPASASTAPAAASPSVPGEVQPVPAPADRLGDCAGLSEGLRRQVEERILLPLVLNSFFEKKRSSEASEDAHARVTSSLAGRAEGERDGRDASLQIEPKRDPEGDCDVSMAEQSGAEGPDPKEAKAVNGTLRRSLYTSLPSGGASSSLSAPSGLHFSRGVVIHGPSGVGKTKLAFAIAGELSRLSNFSFFPLSLSSLIQHIPPFLSTSAASSPPDASGLSSPLPPQSASVSPSGSQLAPPPQNAALTPASSEEILSLIFESAKAHTPALLLLEDIAVLSAAGKGSTRGKDGGSEGGGGKGDAESASPLVRALAREMDALTGFDIMVVATCSHIDSLDTALRRSGRFDSEISVPLPGFNERREVLQALTRSLTVSSCVDLSALADRTVGFVAADLHSLVKEAVYRAVLRGTGRRRRQEAMGHARQQASSPPVRSEEKRIEAGADLANAEGAVGAAATARVDNVEARNRESSHATRMKGGEELANPGSALGAASASSSSGFWPFPAFDRLVQTFSSRAQPCGASHAAESGDASSSLERQDGGRVPLASVSLSLASASSGVVSRMSSGYGDSAANAVLTDEDFVQAFLSFTPSFKKTGAFLPRPNVRWGEVGGLYEAKQEVEERILFPLSFSDFYDRMGVRKPTGILLYGPPGCGKTFLAKALANACQANFIAVKGPELLSKYVGDSEAALRRLFSRASFFSPSLIFFDEIDALCGSRSTGGKSDGGNKVEERVIAQLLTELDGINDRGKVYVVAATNRPDILDPALLRPGRLEVRVYVHLPDQQERAEILQKGWRRLRREQKEERARRLHQRSETSEGAEADQRDELEENDLDFHAIAKATERFSGADLDAVLREATLLMIQEARQTFVRALHQSLNEDKEPNFDPLRLSFDRQASPSSVESARGGTVLETAGNRGDRAQSAHWSGDGRPAHLGRTGSFYAAANADHMCVKQHHLLEAARRITPSVTEKQVRFYEDYREKLKREK
ncbi:cell division protein CDC48 [Besnoitia besnoiti]|uniref:Cell division protein CDC48 n=1 Tax=Besnoitia besnoiti TaxID=94643 RepID=A0A2A9MMU4_BESBE|nr:cell division protein CDC48 [Besnoitia besnoiti]PFH38704.1 cell division protein CDC48 [Besnoitia besnoiti]